MTATKPRHTRPGGRVIRRYLLPERFADDLDEDSYAIKLSGTCLDPVICDGDLLIVTPGRKPRPGNFVIFWPHGNETAPCKRMVMGFVDGFDPGSIPGSVSIAIVEQLNPPKRFKMPADRYRAAHVVVGWLKPEEYEPLRMPADIA